MSSEKGIRIESSGKPHDVKITLIDTGERIEQYVTGIEMVLDTKSPDGFRVSLQLRPDSVQIHCKGTIETTETDEMAKMAKMIARTEATKVAENPKTSKEVEAIRLQQIRDFLNTKPFGPGYCRAEWNSHVHYGTYCIVPLAVELSQDVYCWACLYANGTGPVHWIDPNVRNLDVDTVIRLAELEIRKVCQPQAAREKGL